MTTTPKAGSETPRMDTSNTPRSNASNARYHYFSAGCRLEDMREIEVELNYLRKNMNKTQENDGVDSSCGDESGIHDVCIVRYSKLQNELIALEAKYKELRELAKAYLEDERNDAAYDALRKALEE